MPIPEREGEVLDGLRRLAARDGIFGHALAELMPGMEIGVCNLIARLLRNHTLEELLLWDDDDWLAAPWMGPARLAVIRAHWPSLAVVNASSLPGWREHAEMVAGVNSSKPPFVGANGAWAPA